MKRTSFRLLAALCLTACDDEPAVETSAPADAVALEGAPACCPTMLGDKAPADVAAEACAEVESECGIEKSQCEDMSDCTPEELEQCEEKQQCEPEKSPAE